MKSKTPLLSPTGFYSFCCVHIMLVVWSMVTCPSHCFGVPMASAFGHCLPAILCAMVRNLSPTGEVRRSWLLQSPTRIINPVDRSTIGGRTYLQAVAAAKTLEEQKRKGSCGNQAGVKNKLQIFIWVLESAKRKENQKPKNKSTQTKN